MTLSVFLPENSVNLGLPRIYLAMSSKVLQMLVDQGNPVHVVQVLGNFHSSF